MGGKHTKVQLTGFAAGNAVGDKLSMFVIGKSKKCRCFSGVRTCYVDISLKKSCMDSTLIEEWVH